MVEQIEENYKFGERENPNLYQHLNLTNALSLLNKYKEMDEFERPMCNLKINRVSNSGILIEIEPKQTLAHITLVRTNQTEKIKVSIEDFEKGEYIWVEPPIIEKPLQEGFSLINPDGTKVTSRDQIKKETRFVKNKN